MASRAVGAVSVGGYIPASLGLHIGRLKGNVSGDRIPCKGANLVIAAGGLGDPRAMEVHLVGRLVEIHDERFDALADVLNVALHHDELFGEKNLATSYCGCHRFACVDSFMF